MLFRSDHLLNLRDGREDACVCVEGFQPGAKDGDLCPQVVDGGKEGAKQGNHRHLPEGNPIDVGFVVYREQVGRQVRGMAPSAGNEVDEGLNHLIFGGGGHPLKGVRPKRGAEM